MTLVLPYPDTDRILLDVTVPGRPIPWKRTRSSGRHRYSDPAYAGWRRIIAATADAALRTHGHFTRPVCDPGTALALDVLAAFPRPGRPTHPLPLTGYADADNLAKAAADALEGIVYPNDAALAVITATKAYTDTDPYLRILVTVCDPGDLTPADVWADTP